jgi:hypothetical protein
VLYKDLLVSMLDESALFYLSFGGSLRGKNKILLAEVHVELKAAVYKCKKN